MSSELTTILPMDCQKNLVLPRAMLFDMDGTLTQPYLDFPQIKRDMGIPLGEAILEAMAKMSSDRQAIAKQILDRHEDHAAANSTLNEGCEDLLHWLKSNEIEIGVVTRNSRKSVETVFGRHELKIDVTITREDEVSKPAPQPLYLACKRLGVDPNNVWMIGDGHHDIEAAANASMTSIWISHGRERQFKAIPTHICQDLLDLQRFLKSCDNRQD